MQFRFFALLHMCDRPGNGRAHRQFGEMSVKLDRLREVRLMMEEKMRERDQLTYHINDLDRSIQLCSEKMDRARQMQLALSQEITHLKDIIQKIEDDQEEQQRKRNGLIAEEEQRKGEESQFHEEYSEMVKTLSPYQPESFESISEMRLKSWEDDSRRKLDEADAMPVPLEPISFQSNKV
ncbi:chromosome segregation ATPase [Ammoniphilus resinae]|uniref:Chromosome segregation ATPase n=1 Tax=Ammoniphilus resinae TaxID=861532 RepID=A0ABS4GSH0_9BACL|nr:chromosome segregation ATPase [Ammoniphilus resinae]